MLQPNPCFKSFSLLSGSSPSFSSWLSPAFHFSRSSPCKVSAAGHPETCGEKVHTAGRLLPMCLPHTWSRVHSRLPWIELSTLLCSCTGATSAVLSPTWSSFFCPDAQNICHACCVPVVASKGSMANCWERCGRVLVQYVASSATMMHA